MGSLKHSLKDAVRKLAQSTSVDQLKKRGVKQVNVVGLDRIVQLIEEAIHRSLKHRLLMTEREAVVDATRDEFLRLLRSNEELKEKHERSEEEANNLRLELQRLRQELGDHLADAQRDRRASYLTQDERILDLVSTALVGLESSAEPDQLRERVLEVVMSVVERERRDTEEARVAARDYEVSQLQRRIAKLSSSLEETERRLGAVGTGASVDSGIASIYREVQGLIPDASQFGRKKELMAGIFAANLRLQKKE